MAFDKKKKKGIERKQRGKKDEERHQTEVENRKGKKEKPNRDQERREEKVLFCPLINDSSLVQV